VERATSESASSIAKWVVRDCIALFILLWVLGAFDHFMPSPVMAMLREHDRNSTEVLRGICRGVWKDAPLHIINQECGR
jgi:hypothetical protein